MLPSNQKDSLLAFHRGHAIIIHVDSCVRKQIGGQKVNLLEDNEFYLANERPDFYAKSGSKVPMRTRFNLKVRPRTSCRI